MAETESPRTAKGEPRIEEPTRSERTIARRAAESRATVPELELRDAAEVSAAIELSRELAVPLTAILVRACALALREVPRANGSWSDGRFELYPRVNIAVTLATEGPDTSATILDADRRTLAELSTELRELTELAQLGELTQAQLSGATFTLWDAGRHDVASASALLQPPQAAALVAGAVRHAPVVRDGRVEPGSTIALTLVCDHRILHGREAAALLGAVRRRLEGPDSL